MAATVTNTDVLKTAVRLRLNPPRRIAKRLKAYFPEFLHKDIFLYHPAVEGLVSGIYVDRTRFDYTLGTFCIPLFSDPEVAHLSFGDRLPWPNGHLDVEDGSLEALTIEAAKRFRPHLAEVLDLASLQHFLQRFSGQPSLQNPPLGFAYATAQARAGDLAGAMKQIGSFAGDPWVQKSKRLHQHVQQFAGVLELGPQAVSNLLNEWERKAKLRLGFH